MLRWSGSFVLVFFMIPVLSGANAFSQTNSIDREHDAIIISGEMLAPFAGAPIGNLFLYSFDSQSKIFTQIPFQIDERGISGTDTSFFITDDGLLDDNDELAFMACDLGDPSFIWIADPNSTSNPRIEISLTDTVDTQNVKKGWVYLYRSNTLTEEFTEDYVTYTDPTSGGNDSIAGQTYTVGGNAKGFFGSLFLPDNPGTDLFDGERIKIAVFNESNFSFIGIDHLDGPVRVIRDLKLRLITVDITLPVQYFKSFALQSANLNLENSIITIDQLQHSIALSINANGMKFTNSKNTDILIDGQSDTVDDQIKNSPEYNYTHVAGIQGTIIQLFTIPGSIGDSQALFYEDETNSVGNIGLVIDANDGITGQVPLILKLILLSPNQPSSLGDQLVQFEEIPLVVDTLSQLESSVPVELASFSVSVEKNDVRLTWITASEINNFGFDIERNSHGSKDWQKIDFVEGKGTTTAPVRYEYKDDGLAPGVYNYRLKQMDTDGSFEYSPVISANIGLPEAFALTQNYPNPFNPSTTIDYEIPASAENTSGIFQTTTLTIYNLLGVEVRRLVAGEKRPGFYSISWNGKNNEDLEVPSGVYLYRLQAGKFTDTKKMLLVR